MGNLHKYLLNGIEDDIMMTLLNIKITKRNHIQKAKMINFRLEIA